MYIKCIWYKIQNQMYFQWDVYITPPRMYVFKYKRNKAHKDSIVIDSLRQLITNTFTFLRSLVLHLK